MVWPALGEPRDLFAMILGRMAGLCPSLSQMQPMRYSQPDGKDGSSMTSLGMESLTMLMREDTWASVCDSYVGAAVAGLRSGDLEPGADLPPWTHYW